jgi:hypothetical protein
MRVKLLAIFVALTVGLPSAAFSRAGSLVKCEGVSTAQGYKYVGTYCVDFSCTYVTTKIFDSYCPFSIN